MAWAGLPRTIIYAGVAGAVTWWTFSLWLFWGYQLRWDDASHVHFAQWWAAGNVTELAFNWPGTLMRPYVYHAALGTLGAVFPDILASSWTRPAIAAIQVATFVAVTFRLARAVARFERGLPRAVVIGLLCAPFAALTNTEVLSESISLSIVCMLVAFACPLVASRSGRLGNVPAVLACLALLAMTRTAHLPVSVTASLVTMLLVLNNVTRRAIARRELAVHRTLVGTGLVAWAVVGAPQAWLLWRHEQLVPGDSALWGAAGGQLTWSQQMGKYATIVASCPGMSVPRAPYPVPFVDAVTATGQFAWYLSHPHVAIWHLFQSLNWDFPTTYISTFNPFLTVPLNAVSLGVAVVGLATLAVVGPSLVRRLIAEAPVLGIVLAAIVALWLQTAFTAVETRFGIIPWSALSVAAVWGATRWWERLRRGTSSWMPAINAAFATGLLLLVSRLAVAGVPVFQQYEEAGCWGYRQLTSLGIQSTSHVIRYQAPFPRRTSDEMRVKLVLDRPYFGTANLHIDLSGVSNGIMIVPQGKANEREFIFESYLFRNRSLILLTITSDGVDPNLRLGAWRYVFRRNDRTPPEFITEYGVFAGLPEALTGRMTNEWLPMIWIAGSEWDSSRGGLRWPF